MAHAFPSLRAIAGPVRLVVAGLLLCGFAVPASARAVVEVMPVSAASGFPMNNSYQLSLLDFAAGAEIGDKFAVAGGSKAMEYFGWWPERARPSASPSQLGTRPSLCPYSGMY
jgi:hypothetical protein